MFRPTPASLYASRQPLATAEKRVRETRANAGSDDERWQRRQAGGRAGNAPLQRQPSRGVEVLPEGLGGLRTEVRPTGSPHGKPRTTRPSEADFSLPQPYPPI